MKKNWGIIRIDEPSNLSKETEIIETGLTKEEAESLQEQYQLSERNNPNVIYSTVCGKIMEE